MKIEIRKYGRWNEAGNWQLESRKEKEISEKALAELAEYAGYTYSERYDEYFLISDDKQKLTKIIKKGD